MRLTDSLTIQVSSNQENKKTGPSPVFFIARLFEPVMYADKIV
jgi:hypothetical protein